MPFYKSLDSRTVAGRRTAHNLRVLKFELDKTIPAKTVDSTLLLATWNIREFGGSKSGGREAEPLFYLAEIISRFDIVAVQEVRDNLDELDRLMNILGGWWKYLVSDVTLGAQGNNERHAYIYDTRKISFGGLAGELVPEMKKHGDLLASDFSFARTPYVAGFKAGWFKFTLCTQHFYYGQAKADDPQRVEEARKVVALLKKRMRSKDAWAYNAILLGDFNVFSTKDETFQALEKGMFHIPKNLRNTYTNAVRNKPFDQIAFLARDVESQMGLARAGAFPFFEHVYRDADWQTYQPESTLAKYKQWRTFKMSDHLPLWVELFVDFGDAYLERKSQKPPS
ncbi:MAG: endonuclease/exonuclease/phosphatase family protein [Anaerolineales bacterium]|nr:MAG: endonuclease/exonuclease/phosphatase family protein [Anaerolineales bacterium]